MTFLHSRRGAPIRYCCRLLLVILLPALTACGETAISPAGLAASVTPPASVAPVTTISLNTVAATTVVAATTQSVTGPTPVATTAVSRITTAPVSTTAAPAASPTAGQTTLATSPAVITRAGGEKLLMTVELARTQQEQSTGLMGRRSLPEDSGMLFIFQQPGQSGFWMKNTPLPLSIAFIDVNGKIIDIQDMQPFSEEVHAPKSEYIWALEVPQGYFARKGVRPGDIFSLGK